MVLNSVRRMSYNPLIISERVSARKTETTVQQGVEDPRNEGGSS
jgi:hypothetical protein